MSDGTITRFELDPANPPRLSDEERARLAAKDAPLEFGHTLGDQIGGQLAAGFVLTGLYEDIDPDTILGRHIPSYLAARALKPRS